MAAKIFQALQKRFLTFPKKRKAAGFTLIEIVVSVLIVSVVFTALMSFVVELIQSERREYARSETEREMKMALDFIVSDVREAVFVYDNIEQNRTVLGNTYQPLKDFLPPDLAPASPIFAFWRTDRLSDTDINLLGTCTSFSTTLQQECNDLRIKRRTLTLVVYFQQVNNPTTDPKWKGKSRIMRYELKKYSNIATLTRTSGYVDPLEQSSFIGWPYSTATFPTSLQSPSPPPKPLGGAPVLVDFVDDPTFTGATGIPVSIPKCTSTDPNSPFYVSDPSRPPYRRVPVDPSDNKWNSFFTCVKTVEIDTSIIPANQDVVVYLRGNPTGKAGIKVPPLITLKTQAVARGVVDKQPQGQ